MDGDEEVRLRVARERAAALARPAQARQWASAPGRPPVTWQ